jgi:hypothetical protein
VRALYRALGTAAGISILAACTGGQSGIEPPATVRDVQNTTVLQFRVGTARYNGSTYLNTLVTFRQPNGLSGTLFNSPTITLPPGPVVPAAGTAGTDAGTNHISSTPPTQPGITAVATTFGQSGGAYAYGFANANSTTSGAANYAQFVGGAGANNGIFADEANANIPPPVAIPPVSGGPGKGNTSYNIYGGGTLATPGDQGAYANAYMQPFYIATGSKIPFLLGPPAVPDFHNGTFPSGFLGYDSGFTIFSLTATPVTGSYSLTVNVPSATLGVNAATFTQVATLTNPVALPVMPIPTIVDPGTGGASFVVAPAPAGVTNQVLYVIDVSFNSGRPTHYTFNVPAAGGTFVLSPTSGPLNSAGAGTKPFNTGDSVYAYVVGADYDILALAPPVNTQQSPALPAQADVSVSQIREIVY